MARIPALAVLPAAIFVALAGLFLGGLWRTAPDELPSEFIGQPAPGLPEAAVTGTALVTLADLTAGEVTVVNFWASWCPPCRAEHRTLLDMQAAGVRIVGVNFRDTEAQAAGYLAELGDPFFATGFDPTGRLSIDWGVTAPPETFVIDGDGTVVFRFTGPLIGTDYERRFRPALEAAMAAGG